MEYPATWNLLTSNLAVSDLSDPAGTWRFLAAMRLVRDSARNLVLAMKIMEEERQAPPRPGPSLASRIANRLYERGLATRLGRLPDPWGIIARPRRLIWRRFQI